MDSIVPDQSEVRPIVEWARAGAPLEGGESGDLEVVVALPGIALLALIDGLGHGPEAALAAREAAAVLRAHAAAPVTELIERCHSALHKTRGAVMSVASLATPSSTIDWCGIGNVEALLFRANGAAARPCEALSTRGGVIGYRLPPIKVSTLPVWTGDLLVFASDGIRPGFSDFVDVESEPQLIADSILARYGRGTDDALVLVARYTGAMP
ncbi:MAG TPA: SpoIIE family protein phosphatase [Polyangiaceae bacterium]|jgi:hypothetical protein|nr:SpoIIE family protein phosphatase [Polyangiaceae bacterium]